MISQPTVSIARPPRCRRRTGGKRGYDAHADPVYVPYVVEVVVLVVVAVVLVSDVLVVVVVVVVVGHGAQQLPLDPGVPPAAWQSAADRTIRHCVPQSASAVHVTVGSPIHVPVVGSHVSVGTTQVIAPGSPQVERAAQLTIWPLHPRRNMRL
jgi:hypothetical protein